MLLRIMTALLLLQNSFTLNFDNENQAKHKKSKVGDLLQHIITLNQQKIRVLDKINKIKKDESFRKVFKHSEDFRNHLNDTVQASNLLVLVVPKTNNSLQNKSSRKPIRDSQTGFTVKTRKIQGNSDEYNSEGDTEGDVNDQEVGIGSGDDIPGSTSETDSKNNNLSSETEENTSASEMFFRSHDSKPLGTKNPVTPAKIGRKNIPEIKTEEKSKLEILLPNNDHRKNIIPTYDFKDYLQISDMDDNPHPIRNNDMHVAHSTRRPHKVKNKKVSEHVTNEYNPFIKYERQRFPKQTMNYGQYYSTFSIETTSSNWIQNQETQDFVTPTRKKKRKKSKITKDVIAENPLKYNIPDNKVSVADNIANPEEKTILSKHELDVLHAKYPNCSIIHEDYPNVYIVVSDKPVTDKYINRNKENNLNKVNHVHSNRINPLINNVSISIIKDNKIKDHKKTKTEGLSLANVYPESNDDAKANEMQANDRKHEKKEHLRHINTQTSTTNTYLSQIDDSLEVAQSLKSNNYDMSRKNWQNDLSKRAGRQCKRACVEAFRNVCRRLKCASRVKKSVKKQCRRRCKRSFQRSYERK